MLHVFVWGGALFSPLISGSALTGAGFPFSLKSDV